MSETLIFRVTPEMKQQIELLAQESRRELSDYLRLIFEDKIEAEQIKKLNKSDVIGSLPYHKCQYCRVITNEPDENCFKRPF